MKDIVMKVFYAVRALPGGGSRPVQTDVGVGVGAFSYRYTEVGDFIDFTDRSVFSDRFIAKGTEVGPVVLGGLLGDAWALGGEVRYQKAEADLSDDFLGPKLDLGGMHYLMTLNIRF